MQRHWGLRQEQVDSRKFWSPVVRGVQGAFRGGFHAGMHHEVLNILLENFTFILRVMGD